MIEPEKKATIVAGEPHPDKNCGEPADEIVKLVGTKLQLFR